MMIKKTLIAAALSLPLLASAQNLLTNGSFENQLTSWTVAGGGTYPPAVVTYGTTASTFGEAIPVANDVSLSPDLVGTRALYYVDDFSTQTLSQSFTVTTAGLYAVGFDLYKLANGAANAGNATFSARIDNTSVFTSSAAAIPTTTWLAQTGNLSLGAGSHTVTFTFTTTGGLSKDLAIDRAYVTAVPEPESYALMLAGLAAVGFVARRNKRA